MKANKPYSGKPIICIDFDGVLHSYSSGWKGPAVIPDPPVQGALRWLCELVSSEKFVVCIFSSRNKWWRGRRAMRRWLLNEYSLLENSDPMYVVPHWLWQWCCKCDCYELARDDPYIAIRWGISCLVDRIQFPREKPAATLTIDDRAYRFNGPGTFPTIEGIEMFRPWNKKGVMYGKVS